MADGSTTEIDWREGLLDALYGAQLDQVVLAAGEMEQGGNQ